MSARLRRRSRWGLIARQLYQAASEDTLWDRAAQLSFFFILAIFPFFFFLTTLTAYLPLGASIEQVLSRLRLVAPSQAVDVVSQNLRALTQNRRPVMLFIGLAASIWTASRGVDATRRALNDAEGLTESRPYWKRQLIAIGSTIAGAAVLQVGLALLIAGSHAGLWLAMRVGFGWQYVRLVHWVRWPMAAGVAAATASAAYWLLPNHKERFKLINAGSVLTTLVWLPTTWVLGFYASSFDSYNVTYGSLGGAVLLLTWLYLSGFIFLLGGELNAVLARKRSDATDPSDVSANA